MKALFALAAAAAVAATLAPVASQAGSLVLIPEARIATGYPLKPKPRIHRIDPNILYPVPKPKIPIPGPHCLSCPPDWMNPGLFRPGLRVMPLAR